MENANDFEHNYDLNGQMGAEELIEIHIGDVNLPTGRIIAADPFFTEEQPPFARTVMPDKYPVFIYVSQMDEAHHRIAYARIKFRPEEASRHILALTEDITPEEIRELGEEEFFGFAVESGLACFMDAETNESLINRMDEVQEKDEEANYYDEVLAEEFREYSGKNQFSRELGDWNDHHPDAESDNNVIMFASGWGDGYYPAYWGLNDNGDTVELTIDFLLDDFEEDAEHEEELED